MIEDRAETLIRRAIGGDAEAIAEILREAVASDSAVVIAMAALIEHRPERLERAGAVAATSRDRQVVAIARSHLAGERDLVDALARDHLVDHPDSLIIAWVASGGAGPAASIDS